MILLSSDRLVITILFTVDLESFVLLKVNMANFFSKKVIIFKYILKTVFYSGHNPNNTKFGGRSNMI
jgi:hypothetical protein